MKTVEDVLEWYNKQKATHFHKIKVSEPALGNFSILEFTDVSNILNENEILSFNGRAAPKKTYDSSVPEQNKIRFTRVNNGNIVYSEV